MEHRVVSMLNEAIGDEAHQKYVSPGGGRKRGGELRSNRGRFDVGLSHDGHCPACSVL